MKSTLHHNIEQVPFLPTLCPYLTLRSVLYAVLYEHWASVSAIIDSCMRSMISYRRWDDPTPGLPKKLQGKLTGVVVFRTISELVIQYAGISSSQLIATHLRVGYSIALKPRLRHTRNSMTSSSFSPNGLVYGRSGSNPNPQRSRIPLRPTKRPVN